MDLLRRLHKKKISEIEFFELGNISRTNEYDPNTNVLSVDFGQG